MGLDSYLRAERYVSGYSFDPDERYAALVEMFGVADAVDPDTPSAYVKFTVGYWRKANQIHKWFVDNVQNGVDECKPHYVDRAQLRDLRELCLRVLADSRVGASLAVDPTTAHSVLPPSFGFFFGREEIDDWYLHQLQDAVKQIDRALAMPDDWSFEYRSSW